MFRSTGSEPWARAGGGGNQPAVFSRRRRSLGSCRSHPSRRELLSIPRRLLAGSSVRRDPQRAETTHADQRIVGESRSNRRLPRFYHDRTHSRPPSPIRDAARRISSTPAGCPGAGATAPEDQRRRRGAAAVREKPRSGRRGHAGGRQGQSLESRRGRLRRRRGRQADAAGTRLLDRVAVQADDGDGADDAGGRGQGEPGRPGGEDLPEFKGQWVAVEQTRSTWCSKRPTHRITVRNILSHTSGLPFTSPMEQPTLDLLPLRVAVRSYAMTPLEFEPGASTNIPTRASTRPAGSSRSSAACRTRSSWTSGSSHRWA